MTCGLFGASRHLLTMGQSTAMIWFFPPLPHLFFLMLYDWVFWTRNLGVMGKQAKADEELKQKGEALKQ